MRLAWPKHRLPRYLIIMKSNTKNNNKLSKMASIIMMAFRLFYYTPFPWNNECKHFDLPEDSNDLYKIIWPSNSVLGGNDSCLLCRGQAYRWEGLRICNNYSRILCSMGTCGCVLRLLLCSFRRSPWILTSPSNLK